MLALQFSINFHHSLYGYISYVIFFVIVVTNCSLFIGLFEKRFQELDVTVKSYETLNQKLKEEYHDLQERTKTFESERNQFMEVNSILPACM